jgi:small-conductance mechanosensitive channel
VASRHSAESMTKPKARSWLTGMVAAIIALSALVAGSAFGSISGPSFELRLIAWISAGVLLVSGAFATTRLSLCLGQLASYRSLPSAGTAVRILTAIVGYLIVVFGVLAILEVSIEHLLVGAGLAGIVLGIAATQSLGNVFAGMVLILSRPFTVGDHVRIRSGALGGVFDAWVVEMTLTYTTLRLDDGRWKIPNSAMLAAGVGQLPRTADVPSFPQVPGGVAPAGAAPAPTAPSATLSTPGNGPAADPVDAPLSAVTETVPRPSRRPGPPS